LPHNDIPYEPGLTLRIGDDHWEFLRCKSTADAKLLQSKLEEMRDVAREIQQKTPTLTLPQMLEATAKALMECHPEEFRPTENVAHHEIL
jgi:hypothetical protein